MEQRYKKLSKYAKEYGITYRTAWQHYKDGLIEGAFADDNGRIYIPIYSSDNSNKVLNAALYARVSSNERKDSLSSQLERLTQFSIKNGYKIKYSVKEIASGMNDNRSKLSEILVKQDWDVLIVENKDRLTRFGFNYLKLLLNNSGKEIIVINETDNDKEDILADLISIIYSFSARLYGLRRKKTKTEIIDFLEN